MRLREKNSINDLNERASGVAFPNQRAQIAFTEFRKDLIDVLAANLDGGNIIRDGFQWDDEAQVFFWERKEAVASFGRSRVYVERSFEIDPRKDIAAEIARLREEHEFFETDKKAIRAAIIVRGGDLL